MAYKCFSGNFELNLKKVEIQIEIILYLQVA